MGTPAPSIKPQAYRHLAAVPGREVTAVDQDGQLAEIGLILSALSRKDQESQANASRLLEARQEFLQQFHAICANEVRPAMEAVLETLREAGGDGLIEEHPGGEPRVSTPRLTLWMSLQGLISESPRSDRNPYLQLDADVDNRTIRRTEGDTWRGGGAGHSGPSGTWELAEVSAAVVIRASLDIVRRSAHVTPAK